MNPNSSKPKITNMYVGQDLNGFELSKLRRIHYSSEHCVLYSLDNGTTWYACPVDTGKWHINDWLFMIAGR